MQYSDINSIINFNIQLYIICEQFNVDPVASNKFNKIIKVCQEQGKTDTTVLTTNVGLKPTRTKAHRT